DGSRACGIPCRHDALAWPERCPLRGVWRANTRRRPGGGTCLVPPDRGGGRAVPRARVLTTPRRGHGRWPGVVLRRLRPGDLVGAPARSRSARAPLRPVARERQREARRPCARRVEPKAACGAAAAALVRERPRGLPAGASRNADPPVPR